MKTDLITLTSKGFYCEVGDFYIDPWQPVKRAVITHAHADHFVRGCDSYLVVDEGRHIFQIRLGDEAKIETLAYGASTLINNVKISLHPAGHILGSAQIRVEYQGEVWVVSGDYKTASDQRTCTPFEPVPCHVFITEATFALPIYSWKSQDSIFADLNAWWRNNVEQERASIVYAYALGKAQRVMAGLDRDIGRIFTHGAVERITQGYRDTGIDLPDTKYVTTHVEEVDKADWRGSLIIAPLSARGTAWMKKFGNYSTASVSGWMQIRGARRRRSVDRGFILSDHADWAGLMSAIEATGAERIGVTHGYIASFVRWLQEKGYDARGYDTRYVGEDDNSDTDENEA
ncbi:MAG: ligase-associated DNA damage response exonuclease [Phototrophicaceae bacterium]